MAGVVIWIRDEVTIGDVTKRIVILGTDNRNVFSWIRKGKARVGRSRRMLAAFLLWCLRNDIEVIPFYMRTNRNLSADFITRSDAHGLEKWQKRMQMERDTVPWWWKNFSTLGAIPIWCEEGLSASPCRQPYPICGAEDVRVVEWNGSSLAGAWIAHQFGCKVWQSKLRWHDKDGKNLREGKLEEAHIIIGTARTAQECVDFASEVLRVQPNVGILVSPSEIVPFGGAANAWTQHLWIDTSMLGDYLCGTWNVFIRAGVRLQSLSRTSGVWSPGTIRDMYEIAEKTPLDDEVNAVLRTRQITQSSGRVSTYTGSDGVACLSLQSQMAMPTLAEVQQEKPQWPWISTTSGPSLLTKLS